MTYALTFAIIIGISISISSIMAKTKSVGVTGTVICDGEPVNDGEVELHSERYAGNLIAKTKTDTKGRFTIKGSSKTDRFDPQFIISHKCRVKPCTRRLVLRIPEKYSVSGSNPREMYDIGVIDLKRKFPTETKTCPA
ncbi:hypothetical protein LOAG_05691 [Loa loa]|uniref:Transthyretin-like family protein n=1 Tax=Loa loa TaxID=7209 RepID=A0A1I7W205_LOALO|nr:hypothetical protein LOAG_05691 [Loa loa]EFO22796.1 hypothetical protein LOAG_05691 [Loa loa]